MMRVLAVDHGTARAGTAVCDPSETIVRPLVVVGVPVSLDGAEGRQARITREFRDRLAAVVNVPVETYDERLTTRMADATAREGATAAPDALAAAHLLEAYLAARRGGHERRR